MLKRRKGVEPEWHTASPYTDTPPQARHVAMFSHYPVRTIERAVALNLAPHIRRLQGHERFHYVFWTMRPPS